MIQNKHIKKLHRAYRKHVLRDQLIIEMDRWFQDRGDQRLRLSYPLDADSVVFDVGGFMGNFAEDIHNKTSCQVYLFEPSKKFHQKCVERFSKNIKISCFNYGLSSKNADAYLSDDLDGSSVFVGSPGAAERDEKVKIRDFNEVFRELRIERIDLLKINIEGGEYHVLPHLVASNLIHLVDNIQIQFHHFVSGAEKKREDIRLALSQTHKNDWCYRFVWESWSLKNR
ncbi:MAG: FkbM family methyltransferase [Rhizobiaceae bacterium]|nr:FkbM family methyltransferase [Rhizobiaceae bacterium]